MPVISRFFGIVVSLNYQDHNPPHFHAAYGTDEVLIEIQSGAVRGEMSGKALQMLQEWRQQHTGELLANWDRARNHLPLNPIPPLN
jgi:Domain of unknown function (DUF4160)